MTHEIIMLCEYVCVCVCACALLLDCPASPLNTIVDIKETLYEHHANGGHSNAVFFFF